MCTSSSWLKTFLGLSLILELWELWCGFTVLGNTQSGGEKTWQHSSSLGSFLIESRQDCLQSHSEFPQLLSWSIYKRLVFEMWLPSSRWMESSARPAKAVSAPKLVQLGLLIFFYPLLNIFSSTSQKCSNTYRNAVKTSVIHQLPVIQKSLGRKKKKGGLAVHTSPWEMVSSIYRRLLCRNNLLITLGPGVAISNFLFKPIAVQFFMCVVMLMEVLAQRSV